MTLCDTLTCDLRQVDVAKQAYHQEDNNDDDASEADDDEAETINPRDVGHNIYILAHQLARHNRELAEMLRPEAEDVFPFLYVVVNRCEFLQVNKPVK